MSTKLEKLKQAGIVGAPHAITADDEAAVNNLSDDEVNALIAVKAKLDQKRVSPADPHKPGNANTISF